MKSNLFLIWILAGMLGILSAPLVAQCSFDEDKIFVVSHRGDWRNAPENSLMAIQNCIDLGVNMVEIDLKITKDNQLILLHDNTLDRTTNGTGSPKEYTLAEIKELRLKNGLGRTTIHQIPTLEEALYMAKGRIWLNIDKGYDYFGEVEKVLEKTGTKGQVMIKSGNSYNEVNNVYPNILHDLFYMPIVNANHQDAISFTNEYINKIRPLAFEVCFETLTPQVFDVIKLIKESGSKIWINSLWPSLCAGLDDDRAIIYNERAETWGKIIKMGTSFIQTDRPENLIDYLKQNDLFFYQEPVIQIRKKLLDRNQSYVHVVAHRGDWKQFPENSTDAVLSIIEMGVDILETDVQRTKDGMLIIMHDETLDRTTTGNGKVSEKCYADIEKLRLKGIKGNPTEYRIPTLDEILKLCKGKIILNLDKGERFFDEVMSVVIENNMVDHIIMKGDFSLNELKMKYGKYLDRLIYMPKFSLDDDDAYKNIIDFATNMNPVMCEIGFKTDENKLPFIIKDVFKNSSLLWYNSLAGRNGGHDDIISLQNLEKGYGYLIDSLGACIIQTDEPQYLIEYLRRRNLHD